MKVLTKIFSWKLLNKRMICISGISTLLLMHRHWIFYGYLKRRVILIFQFEVKKKYKLSYSPSNVQILQQIILIEKRLAWCVIYFKTFWPKTLKVYFLLPSNCKIVLKSCVDLLYLSWLFVGRPRGSCMSPWSTMCPSVWPSTLCSCSISPPGNCWVHMIPSGSSSLSNQSFSCPSGKVHLHMLKD